MFSGAEKVAANSPRLTSESPQLHHKKPRRKRSFSQKPPVKSTLSPQQKKVNALSPQK
jgi:hypothetical protein